MNISKRAASVLIGVVGATLVFALGAYGGSISGGERGGFTMNFPAEGVETGGPSPRELNGMVTASLDQTGFIKRWIQPDKLEMTSHVVTNVGDKPYRIRFETEGLGEDVEYHSRDRAWNHDTHAIDREIGPGESVDFGVTLTLPDPLPDTVMPVQGKILIYDVETGEKLSQLSVFVARTGAALAGACCE